MGSRDKGKARMVVNAAEYDFLVLDGFGALD